MLFVKVPQAFVSKDQWSAFIKNPRHAIAAWASRRHVQLTDSWKWSKRNLATTPRRSLASFARPKADLPTLGCAGVDGVFTFPPSGHKEHVTIEWIDRLSKESDKDYFARAHLHSRLDWHAMVYASDGRSPSQRPLVFLGCGS